MSRGKLAAVLAMSLAIPAALLVVILATHDSKHADATTAGTVPSPRRAQIGNFAPDFRLPTLDGREVTLSQFRGRPVVLTFFASWCYPCREDMPVLEKAQREHGNRIAVVGVNYQDLRSDTADFLQRFGVTFTSLIEDPSDNPVAARYDVHAMPDTLFIDARGIVRERIYGQTNTHDLEAALNRLLSR